MISHFSSPDYDIVEAESKEEAEKLGNGSGWCTAEKGTNYYDDRYSPKSGRLFIWRSKGKKRGKRASYQLFVGEGLYGKTIEARGRGNSQSSPEDLVKRFGDDTRSFLGEVGVSIVGSSEKTVSQIALEARERLLERLTSSGVALHGMAQDMQYSFNPYSEDRVISLIRDVIEPRAHRQRIAIRCEEDVYAHGYRVTFIDGVNSFSQVVDSLIFRVDSNFDVKRLLIDIYERALVELDRGYWNQIEEGVA